MLRGGGVARLETSTQSTGGATKGKEGGAITPPVVIMMTTHFPHPTLLIIYSRFGSSSSHFELAIDPDIQLPIRWVKKNEKRKKVSKPFA